MVSSLFFKIEVLVNKSFFEKKDLSNPDVFFDSNFYFYKTRNSSYSLYLSNLSYYVSFLSLQNSFDYKKIISNKYSFYTYFQNISQFNLNYLNSRNLVSALSSNQLNSAYYLGYLEPTYFFNSFNSDSFKGSHFNLFFINYFRNCFSSSSSLVFNNRLKYSSTFKNHYLYSFIDAQSYTVHNTKLEII